MRNFKNNIIWEDPDESDFSLSVSPKKNVYDQSQVENFFSTEIQAGLLESEEDLARESGVFISSSDGKIILDIEGSPPYSLSKNGSQIDSNLFPEDFPYDKPNQNSGYEIEDSNGSTNKA